MHSLKILMDVLSIKICSSCMKKINDAQSWKLFVRICETQNLTEAAIQSNIDPAQASKILHKLEQELGISLVNHAKRPLELKPAALRLLPSAKKWLRNHHALLNEARAIALETAHSQDKRLIRVSIPINTYRRTILNALEQFSQRHPDVQIETLADAGLQALINRNIDVASYGFLPNSPEVFALPLGKNWTFLMASKLYIKRYGSPCSINELHKHRLILRNRSNLSTCERLVCRSESFYITNEQPTFRGDASACREMLLRGEGIAVDMDVGYVCDELASGQIVPILAGWHREPWQESVCCQSSLKSDPTIREIMAAIARSSTVSAFDRWIFWYKHFDLPMPEDRD